MSALFVTASSAHAQQAPPRDIVQRAGRSAIRGRVMTSDGGTPIRRATVRLTSPEAGGTRATSTDADGRYEFAQLAAGRYNVSASKAAYVNWSYGQTRPNGPGRPIALLDNQVADDVVIQLPRGGVIAGRVVDEFGEPVANANVSAMRQMYTEGRRRLNQTSLAQTNDIGEYRLFGLAPGQYYVSATAQAAVFPVPASSGFNVSGEQSGFAPTFYPSTPDVATAQRLPVGVAQTTSGIDIALAPARLASVSGVATDSQGRPMTNGSVQVTRRGLGAGFFSNFGGPIQSDGSFNVPNVTPGEYIFRANSPMLPPAPGSRRIGPPEFSVAFVSVNGANITGVRLSPVTQVSVTGRIVFDDAAAAQSINATMLRVMSIVLNQENSVAGFGGGVPDSTVHDDFSFELKTFPGRIGLRTFAPLLPAANRAGGWQVKSVRVNGADVTDVGFDVGTQGVSGVEVEMTSRVQSLTGSVTDAKGGRVQDYSVAVFAQDRSRWTTPLNRYSFVGRPQDDGTFKITTLPPGEYFAVALDGLDSSDWQEPDTLESLSRLATPFALTTGDTRTLDLKLVER